MVMNAKETRIMTEKKTSTKRKSDTIKIVLYVVFMTTLFMLYCTEKKDKIDEPMDYQLQSYYSEDVVSSTKNDSKIIPRTEDNVKEGYIVWNENCQIPNVSAYDKSIRELIKKSKPPSCSKLPLTSVVLNASAWSYTFKINRNSLTSQMYKSIIKCCYSSIIRNELKLKKNPKDDDRYKVEHSCHPIKDSETIPKSIEFMLVSCELRPRGGKSRSVVHKDVHAMVVDKGQRRLPNSNVTNKPSVMIISIDSLSRLNLIRSMPVTNDLLTARGFVSLDGYTKVADNTFPNVVPILTGMFVEQMTKRCWKRPGNEMDGCPFLWKDFKQQGYVTAYVEDEPDMGTYNSGKYGFRNAPTDYYGRPYMLAAERLLPVVRWGGMSYCLGPRSAADRVYAYVEDFARLHRGHAYFAVFWLNSFSHNDVNAPSGADRRTADTLARLLDRGLLDNAVTVVLSDHGLRFGRIRETPVGWLEDRMPAFRARLPPGYAAARPAHLAALVANRHRLTSPFDLHLTLKQMLLPDDDGGGDRAGRAEGCPTCRSLFRPADANRSCEQAGIASHWCTCNEYEPMDGRGATAIAGGQYVVRQLNGLTAKYRALVREGYACATLSLSKTVSVRSRVAADRSTTGRRLEYLFTVETVPGHGMFEVTMGQQDASAGQQDAFGELDKISRVNMYGFGSTSKCTDDWRLKKHCYCVRHEDRKEPDGG